MPVRPSSAPVLLLMLAAACGAATVDPYEADDAAGEARPLLPGQPQARSIHWPGDVDWAAFTLERESGVVVWTDGPDPGDDTWLHLYREGQPEAPIADNDDVAESSRFSRIEVARLPAGRYLARVQQRDQERPIKRYQLALRLVAPPAAADAGPAPLLPDLIPLADPEAGYVHDWYIDQTTVPGTSLLRLTTAIANAGAGPMELRGTTVNEDGSQDVVQRIYDASGGHAERLAGRFVHHLEHGHIHFNEFALYRLRQVTGNGGVGPVVRSGEKTSFCLEDVAEYDPELPGFDSEGSYLECGQVQGISVGWTDVYNRILPDQWIDVSGMADGGYWLEVVADPDDLLREQHESNNTVRIRIDLRIPRGDIQGYAYEDLDGDGGQDATIEPDVADWLVYLDANRNGRFDQGGADLASSDVPKAIPALGSAFSSLHVDESPQRITGLAVRLDIAHPRVGELEVFLKSPSGRKVRLVERAGGDGADFVGTLDDGAALALAAGHAPFTGSWRPAAPLAVFNGVAPGGHWQLEVADRVGGRAGTLRGWALVSATAEIATRSDALGSYRFPGLPVGDYLVRALPRPGWRLTAPADAAYAVALLDGRTAHSRDFGHTRSAALAGRVFNDLDRDGRRDAAEGGLAGWRVYLDLDRDGRFDQGSPRLPARDTPVAIPDLETARSRLRISGRSGLLTAISVRVDISHTFTPDLDIQLISPAGTRVVLFERLGTEGNDFSGTVFSDGASQPVMAGSAPYAGAFRPMQPLARLLGERADGEWILQVTDNELEDAGGILGWSLSFSHAEPHALSDAGGAYAFTGLPPGQHLLREEVMPGWRVVAPRGGAHRIMVDGAGSVGGLDFANHRR